MNSDLISYPSSWMEPNRAAQSTQSSLVITQHKISQVMFELIALPVHPGGHILAAYCRWGEVYIDIAEPSDPAPLEEMKLQGFRPGSRVTLKKPLYVCTVFEHRVSVYDHAHIYAELG